MSQEIESQEDDLDLQEEGDLSEKTDVDVAKILETNKKLFERAKKAEGFVKDPSTGKWVKPAKKPETTTSEIKNPEEQARPEFDKDEYGDLRFDGYTKEEAHFILKNGGRKALEDANSFVSIALKTKREQKAAEEAATKVSDTSGLSEVERKYTPEQLKNMSAADLEKILPHA